MSHKTWLSRVVLCSVVVLLCPGMVAVVLGVEQDSTQARESGSA